ncbi:hypothetical protein KQI61_07780 [Anaerocolumna aminovalerica]|uniref:hypothetical protein n=1 Tax=Anaerocolumna aminovalerica TaxID=1527 RepID=UPI001C0EB23C|nr:hypothetical protein [Anaerocolumna aminovalerica]MBU5332096.1 hypothetical protein [Anaerocolumna aminovalerica]
MADMKNIIILRNVDGGREAVKTGYLIEEMENGAPVAFGEMGQTRQIRGAYKLTKPTESDTKLGFIYNADVTTVVLATGESYRNINSDPRNISFVKDTIVNFELFSKGQEIAITKVEGTPDKYVIIDTTKGGYKYAAEADITTAPVVLEVIGNKFISVGADRVPSIELLCIKA